MLGNVMLIDDDAFCNRMNLFVLEQHRAAKSVEIFRTALEALSYLEGLIKQDRFDDFPDVILLDLDMTYMSGWGFLDRFTLFPQPYKTKASVYILTSSIQASEREAAELHADVSGYIEKPFTSQELDYVVSDKLNRMLI